MPEPSSAPVQAASIAATVHVAGIVYSLAYSQPTGQSAASRFHPADVAASRSHTGAARVPTQLASDATTAASYAQSPPSTAHALLSSFSTQEVSVPVPSSSPVQVAGLSTTAVSYAQSPPSIAHALLSSFSVQGVAAPSSSPVHAAGVPPSDAVARARPGTKSAHVFALATAVAPQRRRREPRAMGCAPVQGE